MGPHRDLKVDANQAFTLSETLRRTAALEEVGALWFEEPCPPTTLRRRAPRSQYVGCGCRGGSMYSIGQFAEYLPRGAAGIAQADVARVGGTTPWLNIAHAAEAHNMQLCPTS